MEESISHLVLDDDDVSDDPAVLNRSRNRPIAGGPIPMPGVSGNPVLFEIRSRPQKRAKTTNIFGCI